MHWILWVLLATIIVGLPLCREYRRAARAGHFNGHRAAHRISNFINTTAELKSDKTLETDGIHFR